jgi:hypothetical protein
MVPLASPCGLAAAVLLLEPWASLLNLLTDLLDGLFFDLCHFVLWSM